MASITKTTTLNTPVEKVWAALADVGRVNELIDSIGEVTLDGDTRVCAMGEDQLQELIVDVDHDARRVVYSIKQSPFGFEHHSASMQAFEEGDSTRFVWTTDFKPDAVAPALDGALSQALASIDRQLG